VRFLGGTAATSVIGTGTENGISYIDVRFTGGNGDSVSFYIDGTTPVAAANGQTWTGSAYYKLASGSFANCSLVHAIYEANSVPTSLAASTASLNAVSGSSLGSQRISVTRTNNQATTAYEQLAIVISATGSFDITLRIGLPQLELGNTATAVIPTTTAAVSVFESSWYRQDEGTVFAEWFGGPVATSKYPTVAAARQASANNSQNTVEIFQGPSLTNVRANGLVRVSNVDQITRDSGDLTLVGTKVKAALGVLTNDFVFTANGLQVGAVDTLGTLPTVDTFNIGFNSGAEQLNGRISRLTYWPQRLPNNTLVALTQ
jgi:hypothetical protein